MSIRKLIAVAAAAAAVTFAAPAQAEEGVGLYAEFAGSVLSSSEDPTGASSQDTGIGAEQVNGECYFYGQLSLTSGLMDFEFGGQAAASSTSVSQPELTQLQCTLISRAQGIPGERPTLTTTIGPIACPGAVCTIGGLARDWPIRPVEVCISGEATFGPFPVVKVSLQVKCKTKAL